MFSPGKSTPKKRIVAIGLDYDSCTDGYTPTDRKTNFTKLVNFLFKEKIYGLETEYILFNGSRRQNRTVDRGCELLNKNGSVFAFLLDQALPWFKELVSEKTTLDKHCLPDTINNQDSGWMFDQAYEAAKSNQSLNRPYNDEENDDNKQRILIGHMQRLATLDPEAIIDYYFVDDNSFLLSSLVIYFEKNSPLIPPNITLHLVQHAAFGPFEQNVIGTIQAASAQSSSSIPLGNNSHILMPNPPSTPQDNNQDKDPLPYLSSLFTHNGLGAGRI